MGWLRSAISHGTSCAVQAASSTTEPVPAGFGRPQLIFFCELAGPRLHALLSDQATIAMLVAGGHGVALATHHLDDSTAGAVRILNHHAIPVVAWMLLAPAEGTWLNLQNYPQAIERYRALRAWAVGHGLRIQAIGLDIQPPLALVGRLQRWGPQHLMRRLWQARTNVLFAAARTAYAELIGEMHHDGYEVHSYQLPIIADDRRAGSSLAQRALDIVDVPADLEVLLCYARAAFPLPPGDLGGALVRSYGPDADGVGIGPVGAHVGARPLPWEAFERDLLLAAHHADVIYIATLEGCVERGLLTRIAALDWSIEPVVQPWMRAAVGLSRGLIFGFLLLARFSRALFAWLGWCLFAMLLARQLRSSMQRRQVRP